MSLARTVTLRFKPGKREEGLKIVDRFQEYVKDPQGFLSVQVLLPSDPDQATLITLWESEEAREASRQGLFQEILDDLKDLLSAPPEIKDQALQSLGPGIIQTSVWKS